MLVSYSYLNRACIITIIILCNITAAAQDTLKRTEFCTKDSVTLPSWLPVPIYLLKEPENIHHLHMIHDSIFTYCSPVLKMKKEKGTDKFHIIPSGSVAASINFNKDAYTVSQVILNTNLQIASSVAGIPVSANAGITSYNLRVNGAITSCTFSFDRNLFLAKLREELFHAQQEKYQDAFDSLKKIETAFRVFDTIRVLLNNRKYWNGMNTPLLQDSLPGIVKDSAADGIHALKLDSLRADENNSAISMYDSILQLYGSLWEYKQKILAQYQTLDLQAIASQFSLPELPDHLNEQQVIAQAKSYGLSHLNEWLSGLKQLSFGETVFNQSPLTLYGKIASGLTFSYALNNFYFGGTMSHERLNPATSPGSDHSFLSFSSFKQFNVIAQGTIGLGDVSERFAQISITHFKLQNHPGNSAYDAFTPFNNTLISLSTGIRELKGIRTTAEISGSVNSYFPTTNISTTQNKSGRGQHLGYHFQIEKMISKSHGHINVDYLETGRMYQTSGNDYLENDSRILKGEIDQPVFRNKINFSGRMNFMQYNKSSVFQAESFSINYVAQVKYNTSHGSLSMRYNPSINFISNGGQKNELQIIQLQLWENYEWHHIPVSTRLELSNYILNDEMNPDTSNFLNDQLMRLDLQQQIAFSPKIALNVIVVTQMPEKDPGQLNYFLFEASMKWQWKKNIMTGIRMNTTGDKEMQCLGGGFTLAMPLLQKGFLNLQYDFRFNPTSKVMMNNILYHGSIAFTRSF